MVDSRRWGGTELICIECLWRTHGFAQALKYLLSQLDISPILQMRRLRPGYQESPSGQDTHSVSKQARMSFNPVVFSGHLTRLKMASFTGLLLALCLSTPDFLYCLMVLKGMVVDLEVQSLELWCPAVEYINPIPITSSHVSHFHPSQGSQDSHQHLGKNATERGEVREWAS